MKLNIRAFAIAMAIAAAILYAICSFFVGFFPAAAMSLAGYILHMDLSGVMRQFSLAGFVVGLLAVSVGWGILSLIAAGVYNRLTENAAGG